MKKLPEALLHSLEGVPGFTRESFVRVHEEKEQVTSIRYNPHKIIIEKENTEKANEAFKIQKKGEWESTASSSLPIEKKVPWTQFGYYLQKRPSFTFDPLFHAGCYYVQEASSMFLEQAFLQHTDSAAPLKVLDLCAAPGGKSTHIQSLLSPDSLLVSNEVIRNRSLVLMDNIIKWGCSNVIVTNNDPSVFKKLGGYFDVMVVDAPCSGSGLFRKDEEAISEWSPNNVQLCHQRQQRILSDVLPALSENGLLIYSTCSYSTEEDEAIGEWLVSEWNMEPLALQINPDWNLVETGSSCKGYRFYPDKLKGEGFFLACFRKTDGVEKKKLRNASLEKVSGNEKEMIHSFLQKDDAQILRTQNRFTYLPAAHLPDYLALASILNIRYFGIELGEIMKNGLVPAHALALSGLIKKSIPVNELSYPQAIKYLQRGEMNFSSSGKGWQLATYQNHPLGWMNVLSNRVNNYYPKELRILKQSDDAAF